MAQIIPLLGGVRGGSLGREISVNISRITDLPTPKSPPKRGLSNSNFLFIQFSYWKIMQWYYKLYSLLKENNIIKKYSVNDMIIHLKEIRKVKINQQWYLEAITVSSEKLLAKVGVHIT